MSLVSDPNILTKDRLKEELQKHNITLPRSDSKKSVFVDLYKRELLDKREKLDFSSDDEIELSTSTSRRKKKPGTPTKKPIKMSSKVTPTRTIRGGGVNVTSLSDAELSNKLQEMGVSVGPIMESTRKIYQKKLEKLLAETPREPAPVYVSPALADTLPLHDEFSDNTQDEEEEPEPPRPKPATRKSPARSEKFEFKRSPLKPRVTRSFYEEPKDQVDYTSMNSSNNASLLTRRYTQETNSVTEVKKPFTTNNIVTQVAPPAKENKKPQAAQKRRIPVWVQVAIFIILAVVIFLIIQNMEPASANPFKHLTGN